MNPIILVCGSEGQLGRCLHDLAKNSCYDWHYTDIDTLDISDKNAVFQAFSKLHPAVVVNCSAYTAVDAAETDIENAYRVNANAVENLAIACAEFDCRFVHISTDYVYDGLGNQPYSESDEVNPQNVYGASKLEGEKLALLANTESVILRTSWLYSEYGKNFAKTMLKLANEKTEIQVIFDQTGTPTYAGDLAATILKILKLFFDEIKWCPGIYNFSNEGVCSWYDFAVNIMAKRNLDCKVTPINSALFPSKVKRPAYSVLNKHKVKSTFTITIPYWLDSLDLCLSRIDSIK